MLRSATVGITVAGPPLDHGRTEPTTEWLQRTTATGWKLLGMGTAWIRPGHTHETG